MEKVSIELTLEQLQRACDILSQAPYNQIADIIDSIKEQLKGV